MSLSIGGTYQASKNWCRVYSSRESTRFGGTLFLYKPIWMSRDHLLVSNITNQATNQSCQLATSQQNNYTHWATNNQPIRQSINQSIYQSINQQSNPNLSISQWLSNHQIQLKHISNQWIHQSTHQSIRHQTKLHESLRTCGTAFLPAAAAPRRTAFRNGSLQSAVTH